MFILMEVAAFCVNLYLVAVWAVAFWIKIIQNAVLTISSVNSILILCRPSVDLRQFLRDEVLISLHIDYTILILSSARTMRFAYTCSLLVRKIESASEFPNDNSA
jgi:hypothetical protein